MRHYFHPEIEDVCLPDVLFALSDATRLGIAVALADGAERTAGELGGSLAKSTMTHHLKVLREAGTLRVRSEGTLLLQLAAPGGAGGAVSRPAGAASRLRREVRLHLGRRPPPRLTGARAARPGGSREPRWFRGVRRSYYLVGAGRRLRLDGAGR
ncbi:helix-turn-helix domain-containing protein [Streptomyces thinghirensis]|nr:helix-turn-helix domain-containing protein [Streptomyces thinghirensis]